MTRTHGSVGRRGFGSSDPIVMGVNLTDLLCIFLVACLRYLKKQFKLFFPLSYLLVVFSCCKVKYKTSAITNRTTETSNRRAGPSQKPELFPPHHDEPLKKV